MKHYIYIATITLFLFFNYNNQCQASAISLDEIEKSLDHKKREDLQTLEDKKKENISTEVIEFSEEKPLSYKTKAKIIILNKITAKSELVEFKLNEIKFFGNLSVEVQKCVKNSDPLNLSSLMLISVFDNKPDDDKLSIFQGWIDSSNLSISTIEHPVYEIIPKDCM